MIAGPKNPAEDFTRAEMQRMISEEGLLLGIKYVASVDELEEIVKANVRKIRPAPLLFTSHEPSRMIAELESKIVKIELPFALETLRSSVRRASNIAFEDSHGNHDAVATFKGFDLSQERINELMTGDHNTSPCAFIKRNSYPS